MSAHNRAHGLQIDAETNRNAGYGQFDLGLVVAAYSDTVG